MGKLVRVVYYIRVSTEEQKLHGLSLSAQKMKLDEYAKKHGYKYVRSYLDEGVSGRKLIKKRPALQQMLKDSQKNEFDLILFIKLDRYFRSVAEYHECQKILDSHNVLWEATEEKYDLTTANGRAFVNMKLTIAELEADQTGERIRLVNEYKVKEGYALSGAVPFGWALKKENGHSKIIRDPEVEAIVYEALDHFENVSKSIRNTIFYIYDKYDYTYTYKVLRNTFDSTFLYGYYRGNPNYCEAYISKERYDRIQSMINKNIKVGKNKRIYLFSNLITCACCGSRMTGDTSKPHNILYYFYKCNSRANNKKCNDHTYISEIEMEQYLMDHLYEELEKYIIESEMENKKNNKTKTINTDSIYKEIDRLNLMFQKNRIDIDKYDSEYEKLEAKLKEAELIQSDKPVDLTPLKELLENDFSLIYKGLDKEHKRSFWQSILKQIVIKKIPIEGKRRNKKEIKLIFNTDFMKAH